MTNPFTAFAFTATGEPTNRTLPDRLADIKNVKDFGAIGDGVTDDWAAIMAAFNWTASGNRGAIFFPPGTYLVSQPIDFSVDNISVGFFGVLGASTVTGNFSDYVFKNGPGSGLATSGIHQIDGLTIINTNATGGGIRVGLFVDASIRNCVITANLGINTSTGDQGNDQGSLSVSIENCTLSPGANTSGSIGMMLLANGPVINCHINGYATGMITWGQEGAQNILGCVFELCGTGFKPGITPTGASFPAGGATVSGCLFKNCGTGIANAAGAFRFSGIRIEGATGTIAGNPQYGINGSFGTCLFEGVIVTGQFQQYGIALAADGQGRDRATFTGVQVNNSAGLGNWNVPSPAGAEFIGCNYAPVATVAALPAFIVGINTLSWSAGTTTLNLFFNISGFAGASMTITVEGASPSGYNGTFSGVTVTGVNTVTYSQSNPGSPTGSGGNAVINANSNAMEGDCYNVSDSNVSTWGGNPIGGGSTHAKVRWDGSNWTVAGV